MSFRALDGHEAEVFTGAWNPRYDLFATGSGDGTARIWTVPSNLSIKTVCVVLHHESEGGSKDITTLSWRPDGEVLATGSYDGMARLWTREGVKKMMLRKHQGPIFSIKWSRKGDLLVTGGIDMQAVVWDATTGDIRQTFSFHTGNIENNARTHIRCRLEGRFKFCLRFSRLKDIHMPARIPRSLAAISRPYCKPRFNIRTKLIVSSGIRQASI